MSLTHVDHGLWILDHHLTSVQLCIQAVDPEAKTSHMQEEAHESDPVKGSVQKADAGTCESIRDHEDPSSIRSDRLIHFPS